MSVSTPTATDAELRERIVNSIAAEEAACEIMHEVSTKATELMISNHFDRLSVPYTVRCVTKEMLDFINCAFVGQDNGFVRAEGWHADPSADNIIIDTWARSAVSTRPPQKKDTSISISPPMSAEPSLAKTRSRVVGLGASTKDGDKGKLGSSSKVSAQDRLKRASSVASDASGLNVSGGFGGGARGSVARPAGGDDSSGAARKAPRRRASVTGNGDGSGAGDGKAGGANGGDGTAGGDQDESNMSPEDLEYLQRVRADQKKKENQRQLAEKLGKQMDDLKNVKDFTVDGLTGKVLPIKNVNEGRSAHAKKNEMRFFVGGSSGSKEEQDGAHQQDGGMGGSGKQPKAPAGGANSSTGGGGKDAQAQRRQSVKAKKTASDFFQEEQSYGPMVEGVLPSGGVAVKDGDTSKRAELNLPKSKLSRHEFRKMMETTVPQDIQDDEVDGIARSPSTTVPLKPGASPSSLPIRADVPPPNAQLRANNVRATDGVPKQQIQRTGGGGEYRSQKAAVLPQKKLGAIPTHHHVPSPVKKNTAVPPLTQRPKQKVMVHQALLDDPLGEDEDGL